MKYVPGKKRARPSTFTWTRSPFEELETVSYDLVGLFLFEEKRVDM